METIFKIIFIAFILMSIVTTYDQNNSKIKLQKEIIKNQINLGKKVDELWQNLK